MGKAGSPALDSSAGKAEQFLPFRAYPHQMRSAQCGQAAGKMAKQMDFILFQHVARSICKLTRGLTCKVGFLLVTLAIPALGCSLLSAPTTQATVRSNGVL